MQNLPRIFINEKLETGHEITVPDTTAHYLTRVMRTDTCLVFNNGTEFNAMISNKTLIVGDTTGHTDPTGNLTFAFAPIKQARMEEMINMATQMGVRKLQPVITAHTTERFPKWERVRKIMIEASEQSNRNSVPELLPVIKFNDLNKTNLIFADERFAHGKNQTPEIHATANVFLIGPEGGFSNEEFSVLDTSGAIGISLGRTILRAETAAVAGLAILSKQ